MAMWFGVYKDWSTMAWYFIFVGTIILICDTVGSQDIALNGQHSCVVTDFEGPMFCWGRGDNGQLGDGNYANSSTPVSVTGMFSGVLG